MPQVLVRPANSQPETETMSHPAAATAAPQDLGVEETKANDRVVHPVMSPKADMYSRPGAAPSASEKDSQDYNLWDERLRESISSVDDAAWSGRFLDVMLRLPELRKLFDPTTGLPIVQVGLELENIISIDIEEETVKIQYGICLDWFDLMTSKEYEVRKTEGYKNFYFQPDYTLLNVIEHETIGADTSRQGVRYDARWQLGPKQDDTLILVKLKRTVKGTATLNQEFDLRSFPLERHELVVALEPKKVNAKSQGLKHALQWRSRDPDVSQSTIKYLLYRLGQGVIRIKRMKTWEAQSCVVSGLVRYNGQYPFLSTQAGQFRDFKFDTRLIDSSSSDLYKVTAPFYRVSNAFVVQNLAPVLIIILMTLFVNAIEEVGDQMGYLVTLFLSLYAHKYVMIQTLNVMVLTSVELVMYVGYVGVFLQCVVAALSAPVPGLWPNDPVLGTATSLWLQLLVVLVMLLSLAIYSRLAWKHYGRLKGVDKANSTIVPDWLYKRLAPDYKKALRVSARHFHLLVDDISKLEKKLVDDVFKMLPEFQRYVYVPAHHPMFDIDHKQPEGTEDQVVAELERRIQTELGLTPDLVARFTHKGRIVNVKAPTECYVKRRVRKKPVNDKFRTMMHYDDPKEAIAVLRGIAQAPTWTLFKLDTNVHNATSITVVKAYALFEDMSYRGHPVALELMFQSSVSRRLIEEKSVHATYRVLRLLEAPDMEAVKEFVSEHEYF